MNQKSLRLQIHHEEPKHTPNVSEQMYQSSISELSNDEGIEKDEDDEEKTEEKESDSTTGLLCVRTNSHKEDEVQRVLQLRKDERTDRDVGILVDSFKHMGALSCMSQSVVRKLCAAMFVTKYIAIDCIVLRDDAEINFWYVVLDGELKVKRTDGSITVISIGESFGVCNLNDSHKLQEGVMTTNSDKCELGCVEKKDFIKIFQEYQESMLKVEENGEIVMVLERKSLDDSEENIVIQGTKDKLIAHLLDNKAFDPNYLDDFLLTYRVFIEDPCEIMQYLLNLFKEKSDKNKISRVILHWVNAFHKDFEKNQNLQKMVSRFKTLLSVHSMSGNLKMLEITEASHAKPRSITLTRSDKNEPLGFLLCDGHEKGIRGIFVRKVNNHCRGSELGMKEGDQVLQVNNRFIDHLSAKEACAMIMNLTHISLQLKYNYQVFKEIADHKQEQNKKKQFHTLNPKVSKKHSIKKHNIEALKPPKHETDPYPQNDSYFETFEPKLEKDARLPSNKMTRMCNSQDDLDKSNDEVLTDKSDESTRDHYKNSTFSPLLKAKSFFVHPSRSKALLDHHSPNSTPQSPSINKKLSFLNVGTWVRKTSTSSILSPSISKVFASSSQPDIFKIFSLQNTTCTDIIRVHFDTSYKNLYINQETNCQKVVELSVAEFGLKESPKNFNLCEVIFEKSGLVKTRTLPGQTCDLFKKSPLNARYFLKHQELAINIPEEMSAQVAEDLNYELLDIPHSEIVIKLTLRALELLQQVDQTEHVVDLFKKDGCTKNLQKFSQLSNQEMLWVPTVLCSEANINKRCKLIKHFIKIAKSCKKAQNFNSFFSIISGLRHGSVERLRNTWEKMNPKDLRSFESLQSDMDPTRNMARYRILLNNKTPSYPAIPFYPIFKKDLTFIDLGNDTIIKGTKLVNFDKMRMVSSTIRDINKLTSGSYMGSYNNFKPFQTNPLVFQSKSYEMTIQGKKASKYIQELTVVTDEEDLYNLSYQCEPSNRPSYKTQNLKPSEFETAKISSDCQSLYIIASSEATFSSTSTNTLSSITTSGFSSLSSLTSSLSSPRLSALSSSTFSLALKSTHVESTF